MSKYLYILSFILFLGCGEIDFMDYQDSLQTNLRCTEFTTEYYESEMLVYCVANFVGGIGQTVSEAGICWTEDGTSPDLSNTNTYKQKVNAQLELGIDINGDAITDLPGATSGDYSTLGIDCNIPVSTGITYTFRPYVLLNNDQNIVYGLPQIVDTN